MGPGKKWFYKLEAAKGYAKRGANSEAGLIGYVFKVNDAKPFLVTFGCDPGTDIEGVTDCYGGGTLVANFVCDPGDSPIA